MHNTSKIRPIDNRRKITMETVPRFFLYALAIFQSFVAHSAFAQGTDLADLDFEDLAQVKVSSASRFVQTTRDAPSAVEVITREDIRRHRWRTLAEVMDSLPGVYTTNDRAYSYVGARGFLIPGDYNTRFLVMIDGQRTNDNIYEQASFSEEFALDLALIERIEYVPGPGSSIYGSNAVFGVINVITRKTAEMPPLQLEARASEDRWRDGRATGALRLDSGAGLLLSVTAGRKGGRDQAYDDPAGSLIALGGPSPDAVAHGLDSQRKRQFYGRYEDGPVSLAIRHAERRVRPSSALYGTLFDDAGLVIDDGMTSLLARYQRQASENLGVEARVEYGEITYKADYPYDDVGDGTGARYLNREDALGRWWAGEFRIFFTGFAGHKIVAGIDGQRDTVAQQRNFDVGAATPGTPVDIDSRRHRIGIYVQDEWAFADAWRLSAGLRHDYFSSGESSTSPRLGLIWLASPETTGKLIVGRAFRVPNHYERDFSNGSTYLANTGLRPETIRTVEAVVDHRFGGGHNLRLSVFDWHIENLIAQQDLAGQLQYRNQPMIHANGAEATWRMRRNTGTQLEASFAYNDVKDATGKRPGYSPSWVGKLRGGVPIGGERWTLSAEARASSATVYQWNGSDHRLPMRLTVDAAVTGSRLMPGIDVFVRVRNLFDRKQSYPSSEEVAVATVPDARRTFEAGVSYSF